VALFYYYVLRPISGIELLRGVSVRDLTWSINVMTGLSSKDSSLKRNPRRVRDAFQARRSPTVYLIFHAYELSMIGILYHSKHAEDRSRGHDIGSRAESVFL
jgi:hypothetical protein